ncbi:MAG: hypothetical protein H0U12_02090 [Thermoleophilaceae bacterium]|nr:hypothetical protein [Thermoleophilaceae bacterium]
MSAPTARRPAGPTEPASRRHQRVRPLLEALVAAALGLAVYAAFDGHAFLNYDSAYALAWGADLAAGRLPQYDVPVAPTPHPLAIAGGVALAPLGSAAEGVFLALVLLGLGALGVGLFRLGEELYAWPVGLLAAAIVLTRQPILNYGIRGYVDLPALALVVWAAVLEARRRRRGAPVLLLLALAGLLRPEAWLFAGAYWLWIAPPLTWPARARLGALALAAPALWGLSDLLATGNPLWSLEGTSALAAELERPTGLLALPGVVPYRLGEILRLPELIAAVLGFAAALVWLRRRTVLPAALAVLNGIAFAAFAVAGLPLLGRYLFLAAAMLALFAAVAALGFTALSDRIARPVRWAWTVGGLAVLAGLLVFLPVQLGRLEALRADIGARDRVQDDLQALVERPAVAGTLARCRPLFVPNHRNVPSLALRTGVRADEIVSAQLERPTPGGLFLAPASARVEELSILDPNDPSRLDAAPPRAYRPIARNRSWLLFGSGACRGAE